MSRTIHKLPLRLFGLKDAPAVPFEIEGLAGTLIKLGIRAEQTKQATYGLSNVFTIQGTTAPAYAFLFGGPKSGVGEIQETKGSTETVGTPHRADQAAQARAELQAMLSHSEASLLHFATEKVSREDPRPLVATPAGPLTGLSLDDPTQFSLSWTRFSNVYRDALQLLDTWSATLTDVTGADRQFWPTIANHGLAYNLLILKKVDAATGDDLAGKLGSAYDQEMRSLQAAGRLYVIDLSLFESLKPRKEDGFERFTPATITLLRQEARTKALTPIMVRVSGNGGAGAQVYVPGQASPGTWLYALQAAKTSATVHGIWLGHVYHWHLVTAAMQMTMYETLSTQHPVYRLLAPQSNYLISFDDVLLLLWESIAPPTSVTSAFQFLRLINDFAKGRRFFDDDPTTTLENLGLQQEDFTVESPWDQYPIVRYLLRIWSAAEKYAGVFVEATYPDDGAVAGDGELQKWIQESSSQSGGNIRGLPAMNNRGALRRVLTSLVYRITMHGCSRQNPAANPALTFVSNYPPCLQQSAIPTPSSPLGTRELLQFLPTTGTIGKMVNFYFTFVFSPPYEPFVPLDGVESDLFFPGGLDDPRNRALVAFRRAVIDFIQDWEGGQPVINQWPLNIET